MKKGVRLMKRALAIAIVFCMSINSFAAIIADNDGSAFITKAEFDSLKNSFQSQIYEYNSSIDSKIEGAIAAYLAGIKTASKVTASFVLGNCTLFRIQNGSLIGDSENKMPNFDARLDWDDYGGADNQWGDYQWLLMNMVDLYYKGNNKMRKNLFEGIRESDDKSAVETDDLTKVKWLFKGIIDDWQESYQLLWYARSGHNVTYYNAADAHLDFYKAFTFNFGNGYKSDEQLITSNVYKPDLYYKWGNSTTVDHVTDTVVNHMRINCTCSGSHVAVPYVGAWGINNQIEASVSGWNNTFNQTKYSNYIGSTDIKNTCTLRNNTSWLKGNVASGRKNKNEWEFRGRVENKVQLFNNARNQSETNDELSGVGRIGTLNCSDVLLANDEICVTVNNKKYKLEDDYRMTDGFLIYYSKEDTNCEWKPEFKSIIINGEEKTFEDAKINIVLSYAPFSDGLECGNKYLKKNGETQIKTIWETNKEGKATIKFKMPTDGWIYAKWYPAGLSDSDLASKDWKIELDGKKSNNFTYEVE